MFFMFFIFMSNFVSIRYYLDGKDMKFKYFIDNIILIFDFLNIL